MFNRHLFNRFAVAIALSGAALTLLPSQASAQIMSDAGFLDIGDTVDHTFQGTAGQDVTISVYSEDFDAYMTVYGPGGRFLVEVDDANGSLNPAATVTLPRTGTYRVLVGGYNPDGDSGRYFINVDESGPVTLLYDSNYLDPGRYQQYFLEGTQGQTINIALESSEFDPYLRVYDSSNRQIASVDDSEGSLNAVTSVTLPQSGRYRILVQGYSTADSGQYSLTVSE
jgi:hypothetical protein